MAGDFILAFPVTCINVLSEGLKVLKVWGLAHAADPVFDSVGKTGIEFMAKSSFSVTAKWKAEMIELNE